MHTQPAARRTLLTALLLVLAALLPACGDHARVTLKSTLKPTTLRPDFTTRLYSHRDENTVDIYLTDLTPEQLAIPFEDRAAGHPTGQIMHIHMFIRPSPGKTPIEPQASNASIRHLILAPGAKGLYGGGGFLLPSGAASSGIFKGKITAGTLKLQAATERFNDALGPTEVRANFRVKEDPELAAKIARRFEEAIPRPD